MPHNRDLPSSRAPFLHEHKEDLATGSGALIPPTFGSHWRPKEGTVKKRGIQNIKGGGEEVCGIMDYFISHHSPSESELPCVSCTSSRKKGSRSRSHLTYFVLLPTALRWEKQLLVPILSPTFARDIRA